MRATLIFLLLSLLSINCFAFEDLAINPSKYIVTYTKAELEKLESLNKKKKRRRGQSKRKTAIKKVYDNNTLYGFDATITKLKHEKVMGLQDIGTFYVVNRPLKLRNVDAEGFEVTTVEIEEGTVLYIMDKKADAVLVSLLMTEGEGLGNFAKFWVSEASLWKSRLVKIGSSLAYIDEVSGHEVHVPLALSNIRLHENRTRGKRLILQCYRRVKEYLLRRHLVESYLPGRSARVAAKHLRKAGFKRIIGPRSSPVGSVCVYSGGWHGHGHIEVKRGARCWWYGYGCKPKPVKRRKLLGCFHKGWGATRFATFDKVTPKAAPRVQYQAQEASNKAIENTL